MRAGESNRFRYYKRLGEITKLATTYLFDNHWEQALRSLRKKGMGKHRRGSNAESGMRRLRRLEKNHDGIRSAATRQHYVQIYQAITYLSLDIAAFIEKGPGSTRPLRL